MSSNYIYTNILYDYKGDEGLLKKSESKAFYAVILSEGFFASILLSNSYASKGIKFISDTSNV